MSTFRKRCVLRLFALCVLTLLLSNNAVWAQQESAATLNFGQKIAQKNCGRCHAVDRVGASPNPKSPPFRYLARKYPLENLEEARGEGIVVGHDGMQMPEFRLSTMQIEAFLAYLESIQKH